MLQISQFPSTNQYGGSWIDVHASQRCHNPIPPSTHHGIFYQCGDKSGSQSANKDLRLIFKMHSKIADLRFKMEQFKHMQGLLLNIFSQSPGMEPISQVKINPNIIILPKLKHVVVIPSTKDPSLNIKFRQNV